jgi:hypothetical protein
MGGESERHSAMDELNEWGSKDLTSQGLHYHILIR